MIPFQCFMCKNEKNDHCKKHKKSIWEKIENNCCDYKPQNGKGRIGLRKMLR